MTRNLSIVAICCIFMAGCSKMVETDPDTINPNLIMYTHDSRTNLCFSFITVKKTNTNGDSSYSISHSNVPCSENVMKLANRPLTR